MATSVSCGPAWLMDGPTYDGQVLRTNHVAASFYNTGAAQVRGGVMPSGGQMFVSPGGGMSVGVATGYALCPSSAGSTQGGYLFGLMSAANLTVATSDPTNPRVDLVAAYANDLGSSSSSAFVVILTGTPTAGASLANLNGMPAVPGNGIALAHVLVPAGSSSVTSGNIQNVQPETVAQGGILPTGLAFAPAGYTGSYIHDLTSGRLMHNPASGAVQPKLLPFAPQQARLTANTVCPGSPFSPANLLQVTVTTDGNTDIEIVAHWPGIRNSPSFGLAFRIVFTFEIDSTPVAATYVYNPADDSVTRGGGDMTHVTMSGVDRPSAGTHTITLTGATLDDTTGAGSVAATGSQPVILRVAPVCL